MTTRTYVYLAELEDAFMFAGAAGSFDSAAYVSRETGRTYFVAESAGLDEEIPGDPQDESLYARVPDKHHFDLGQHLIFRFIDENAPDDYDEVRGYFSRRGAYARFKGLLERRGLLEAWRACEQAATEAALREWAEEEGFEVVEGRRPEE